MLTVSVRLVVISKHDHSYVMPSTLKFAALEPSPSEKAFGTSDLRHVSEFLELPKGSSFMLTRVARDLRGLFHVDQIPRPDGEHAYGEPCLPIR